MKMISKHLGTNPRPESERPEPERIWIGDPEDGKEKGMSWVISDKANDKEKTKADVNDFLQGLNSSGDITYAAYSEIFDFVMDAMDGMHTAADLEKAREEERGKILEAVTDENLDKRSGGISDPEYTRALINVVHAIKELGPASSLEDRVRRETVEKVKRAGFIVRLNPYPDKVFLEVDSEKLDAIARGEG